MAYLLEKTGLDTQEIDPYDDQKTVAKKKYVQLMMLEVTDPANPPLNPKPQTFYLELGEKMDVNNKYLG